MEKDKSKFLASTSPNKSTPISISPKKSQMSTTSPPNRADTKITSKLSTSPIHAAAQPPLKSPRETVTPKQDKVGVLMKKSVFGNWKPRRFVLSADGVLRYGPPENPNYTKTAISLEGCIVQNADAITNRPFSFGVFGSKLKHPILLLAKDIEEEKSWVDALGAHCNAAIAKMNIVDILEGIGECIVISNERGVILSLNKAARDLFGYSKAEAMGQNVSILMPITYKNIHDEFIEKYLNSGENKIIGRVRRVTAKKKDGTVLPIQLNLGEMSTPEGLRFIATIRPVVEVTTYKTRVVLQDTRRVLDERIEALKNSVDFEFNQLKDRIMELEEERKKFKQKTNDMKFQLMMQTKWRALAETKLSNDQKKLINEKIEEEFKEKEATPITVTLPGERKPKKKFDYLSKLQLEALWMWLPQRLQIKEAQTLFTTEEHGRSLLSFYNRCANEEPTILLIKTYDDYVFGAFCSHAWRRSNQFFGNGESFLFSLVPHMGKYGWTSNQPPYFMMGTDEELILGGGTSGYGLRFNLEQGWSQPCDTFHNQTLYRVSSEPFKIALLQVYSFR